MVVAERSIVEQDFFFGYVSHKYTEKYLQNVGDWCVRGSSVHGCTELMICVKKQDLVVHDYAFKELGRKGWAMCAAEAKVYPKLADLIQEMTRKLRMQNAVSRPAIFIPPGSLEWQDCSSTPLGKGEYGTVLQAVVNLENTRHHVAVKVPRSTGYKNGKPDADLAKAIFLQMDQMMHEAEVMKAIQHENIVKCFGIDSSEPPIKLVLDFCPGGSLLQHLQKNGPSICVEERIMFMLEAARGVKYLHRQCKCIHRDLAARNCLIGRNGQLMLSDFGLSVLDGKDGDSEEAIKVPIPWLPPECLTSTPRFSPKSDIFSFAILMYEVVTNGRPPWPDLTDTEAITRNVRNGKRMDLPESTPKDLAKTIRSCWSHLPYDRPESLELVAQLRRLLNKYEVGDCFQNELFSCQNQRRDRFACWPKTLSPNHFHCTWKTTLSWTSSQHLPQPKNCTG